MMFIKPCDGRVTSPFGYRIHPITHVRTMHQGVDYGNTPSNNAIIAAAAGKVTFAKSTNGYGNTVMIVHTIAGKMYETVYAHLASIAVKVGQSVKQGECIGIKGTTGNSTGIHLHFEVHTGRWNNKFTNAVDPLHYVVDPEVKHIQNLLVKVGYKIIVDGIAGKATESAIKAYQKAAKLTVDGIAGKATIAALEIATAPKPIVEVKPVPKDDGKNARAGTSHQAGQDFVKENGISDGTYPGEAVTREQVWTMLERMDRKLYSKK